MPEHAPVSRPDTPGDKDSVTSGHFVTEVYKWLLARVPGVSYWIAVCLASAGVKRRAVRSGRLHTYVPNERPLKERFFSRRSPIERPDREKNRPPSRTMDIPVS